MIFIQICLLTFTGLLVLISANSTEPVTLCSNITTQLQRDLSSNATIDCGVQDVRWSDYAAPNPGVIVTVGSEDDIATTVAFASQNNIPFLLQSGGHGWANTFNLGSDGIVIDVKELKTVTFNSERTEVTFQAGVLIGDLVSAAWANNPRVATGTCNCVGVLGASLGGGLGRSQGLYGLGADQLLAVNYVDSEGDKRLVTPVSDPDLWWALKGAGPNFGIVTSVVFKSYPVPQANNTAWQGILYYNDSQIEAVVSAINNLTLEPEMQLDFYYVSGAVLVLPFYIGSEELGRQKFSPLFDIGPVAADTAEVSYDSWNDGSASFCLDGGRKPVYAANLNTLKPAAWRSIWDELNAFVEEYPDANETSILTECYPTAKSLEIGSSQSSYPWRSNKCYAMVITWYTDPSLDEAANDFGQRVRSLWESSSGDTEFSVYINFAHGDESLSSIYGSSLPRLQQLKREHDPNNRFSQWFAL